MSALSRRERSFTGHCSRIGREFICHEELSIRGRVGGLEGKMAGAQ